MTFDDIYELSEHIPENSRIFNVLELPSSDSDNSFEINRFAICYRDLSFLWNFVKSFVDAEEPLPNDFRAFSKKEDYDLMRRVYNFEKFNTKDKDLAYAIALDRVLPAFQKNVLKACLLANDFEMDGLSSKISIPTEVVKIYEKLFFNVLDRKEENLFIAGLVYPESRVVEMDPAYSATVNYPSVLKRTGYRNGMEDVLNMAGVQGHMTTGPTQIVVADFENKIMCNALFLARAGFLNSNSLGVANAKNLLAAAKHGGDTESGKSDDLIGAASIGDHLMEEVVRFSMDDVEKRRQYTIELNEAEQG